MEKNEQRYFISQFSQLERQLIRWYQQQLSALGVTLPAVYAMEVLAKLGAATPTQLAKQLSISKATVTALLDRMQRQGWIYRDAHSTNRKLSIISLTAEGKLHYQQALLIVQQTEKTLTKKIDMQQLSLLLETLAIAIDGDK